MFLDLFERLNEIDPQIEKLPIRGSLSVAVKGLEVMVV